MVTGNTGERILVSGQYKCQEHPEHPLYLIKEDIFPRCNKEADHIASWELIVQPTADDTAGGAGNTNGQAEKGPLKNEKNKTATESEPTETANSGTLKRKGFYAALNAGQFPNADEYKLVTVTRQEEEKSGADIKTLKQTLEERLKTIKKEFDYLAEQLKEKKEIKGEFVKALGDMKTEYGVLLADIKKDYESLRKEIKTLGEDKEDLVVKRIEKFEAEINKAIGVYQQAEQTHNDKFKKDFDNRKIESKDKQFYYDYRDSLASSLKNVQARVHALESEGLNFTIARFLITIGWIAAFVSSWFFALWYEDPAASGGSLSSNILIYILDNLRHFVLSFPWYTSLWVFTAYILIILWVARYSYRRLVKEEFIPKKKKKGNENGDDDRIELDIRNEDLIRAQFKATTWYELWLKLVPFIAILLFLIIILAIGSLRVDSAGKSMTYESLNNTLSLQVVGFLLPMTCTGLIFLYLTKIIEARVHKPTKENTQLKTGAPGWEIILAVLLFIVLISLLLLNQSSLSAISTRQIGAWGFFVGCTSTGLALGYGYRFISLYQSSEFLVNRIHEVNRYIERAFYAAEAHFLKDGRIFARMKLLYHSLLNLLESRNELAAKIMNPLFEPAGYNQPTKNKAAEEQKNKNTQPPPAAAAKQQEHPVRKFFRGIAEAFRMQHEELKQKDNKIDELESKIENLEKDTLGPDDTVYFPAAAAGVKEIKIQIDERNKRLLLLKEELDGYFRNEKTWASINQQIANIQDKQTKLAADIEKLELNQLEKEQKISEALIQKINFISEGYQLGLWYTKNIDKQP